MKKQSIKAKIFDKKFDKGEDISKYLDISKANRQFSIKSSLKINSI